MARLSDQQLDQALAGLPGWRHEGDAIVRDYECSDAVEAIGFIVQVAALQERADHHAAITWTYNRVRIALNTHDEVGITERDITLAREIEERAHTLGA